MIPDAAFFVRRLTEAVDTLWPSLERSLRTTMSRDPKFKKQLRAWATRQGIANRELRQQLYAAFHSRTLDQATAERLTEKTWLGLRLPEIEGA
jgi:hypothetical protein